MTATEKEIERLLREHGFQLHRHSGHRVWKNPAGKIFTTSCTNSDRRAARNALRDLHHLLGITVRHVPGVQRRSPTRKRKAALRNKEKLPGTTVKPVRTWRGQLGKLRKEMQ